jgi:hypothetical protein
MVGRDVTRRCQAATAGNSYNAQSVRGTSLGHTRIKLVQSGVVVKQQGRCTMPSVEADFAQRLDGRSAKGGRANSLQRGRLHWDLPAVAHCCRIVVLTLHRLQHLHQRLQPRRGLTDADAAVRRHECHVSQRGQVVTQTLPMGHILHRRGHQWRITPGGGEGGGGGDGAARSSAAKLEEALQQVEASRGDGSVFRLQNGVFQKQKGSLARSRRPGTTQNLNPGQDTSTRHLCQYRFISHGGMCLCFVLCRHKYYYIFIARWREWELRIPDYATNTAPRLFSRSFAP